MIMRPTTRTDVADDTPGFKGNWICWGVVFLANAQADQLLTELIRWWYPGFAECWHVCSCAGPWSASISPTVTSRWRILACCWGQRQLKKDCAIDLVCAGGGEEGSVVVLSLCVHVACWFAHARCEIKRMMLSTAQRVCNVTCQESRTLWGFGAPHPAKYKVSSFTLRLTLNES